MNFYVECFIMLPLTVILFQFYSWIVSLEGLERQQHCRALGIAYTTLGTVAFVFRTLPTAVLGFVLVMLGLRLIAQGLDRIGKTVFIDQLDEDR